MINSLAARDAFQDVREIVLTAGRCEHGYLAAYGFSGRVAKNSLGAAIPGPDDAVQVFTNDGVV
jgi:hypothetical protein